MTPVTFYRRPVGGAWTDAQPLGIWSVSSLEEAKEIALGLRERYRTSIRFSFGGITHFCLKG